MMWREHGSPVPCRAGLLIHKSNMEHYLLGLYWAFSTFMGQALGDVVPVTTVEFCILMVIQILGGALNAYLVGGIVSALHNMNVQQAEFYRNMDLLNTFLVRRCRLTSG